MIPLKLRNKLSKDPYYKVCCLTNKKLKNGFKIDWHHAWQYKKSSIQEEWAIMPIYYKKHNWFGDKDAVHNSKRTDEYVKYLSLQRVSLNYLEKNFPKKDWKQIKEYLTRKYERTKSENNRTV